MVRLEGRLDVAARPRLNAFEAIGKGVRTVSKRAVTTVENTEDFDKLTKFIKAILDALSFIGLTQIFSNIKNVASVLSDGSKVLNATNIFSRFAECTRFYNLDSKGRQRESFYNTPNPKATVGGFDFKRVSRGFLFAGHVLATAHFTMGILGYAKIAGHYIEITAFRLVPGVELFMNVSIWISSLLNTIGTSISLHRVNQDEGRAKSAIHETKWRARANLFKALETNDLEKQEKLKKIYLSGRAKLNPEEDGARAEEKWTILTRREIFDNVEQRKDVRAIADRKVKLYSLKVQKVGNERHKSIIALINEVAKMTLIAMAIAAATLTALAITPVVPFLPFFVAFGLIAGTTGIWKAIVDRKSTDDASKLEKTIDEQRRPHELVNYYKNAYNAPRPRA
jgi:hypothetical protein